MLVAFGALVMVSCKKTYSCSCQETETDSDGSVNISVNKFTVEGTKDQAKTACNEGTVHYDYGFNSSSEIKCTLTKGK